MDGATIFHGDGGQYRHMSREIVDRTAVSSERKWTGPPHLPRYWTGRPYEPREKMDKINHISRRWWTGSASLHVYVCRICRIGHWIIYVYPHYNVVPLCRCSGTPENLYLCTMKNRHILWVSWMPDRYQGNGQDRHIPIEIADTADILTEIMDRTDRHFLPI